MLAWGSHIDGAVQLVSMRGKEQLRSTVGRSLFRTVRALFVSRPRYLYFIPAKWSQIIQCLVTSKKPTDSLDWWASDSDDPGDVYYATSARFSLEVTELRSEINLLMATCKRTTECYAAVADLQQRAQELQSKLKSWEMSLPEDWDPVAIGWNEAEPGFSLADADLCPGRIDGYKDLFMAATWNTHRVSRLLLYGVEVRCAAWLIWPSDIRKTSEYAAASRSANNMITDIVASVPYHLDQIHQLKHNTHVVAYLRNMRSGGPKVLGGYFCMWPLYTAHSSDFATSSQRIWIAGRLNFIYETLGMSQARVFGKVGISLHYNLVLDPPNWIIVPSPPPIHAYPSRQHGKFSF